jgi:hypothetical protein
VNRLGDLKGEVPVETPIGMKQTASTGEDREITIVVLDEAGEGRIGPAQPNHGQLSSYAPSPGQIMLLLGGMAVASVAVVYAFSRNRERLLEDARNIDRRWDRPDRLADTMQEERRWGRERLDPDQRAGLRSHSAGFAI